MKILRDRSIIFENKQSKEELRVRNTKSLYLHLYVEILYYYYFMNSWYITCGLTTTCSLTCIFMSNML